MNKHRLGVSHRRGGLFYRLYFITVCHLHGGMLIASCDYLHIWKSTSICHVPPISHESVPPSPDEQLLFIHKVTGSARAWRHLHLTSCRLTYVNPATSAHVHTENISPCRVTPHRKKKKNPHPFSITVFSQGYNIHNVFWPPLTFACATAFWEDSYGEALVSNEQEPINSNQSKRDYEVNYLYSLLG